MSIDTSFEYYIGFIVIGGGEVVALTMMSFFDIGFISSCFYLTVVGERQ